ncbi:MAG TPA: ABC transporter ATP-binding protein [Gaiellaceae bacterium]|nr:ABC transporter ATP-binding protein [Gaiellaceae bacterium]
MSSVVLERLSKRFGDVEAVRELTLDIGDGEFFSLLGPSGCGKTTTLRLIAGFEEPTDGRIFIGDREVTQTPAHKRPVNTVFQSYALFPHLTVADNVAFGLRFKSVEKRERRRRVGEALQLVRLEGFERRKPSQLSGGQQQRVALARALILEPAVLLLDEPLGALDAKLRRSLQIELKSIQEAVGITFVYVTHDQEEALTMSDRMAVMSDGLVQQLGTPRDVYEEPATTFVADFLGVSNLMSAHADGGGRVRLGEAALSAHRGDVEARGEVRLTIRPERVRVEPAKTGGDNRLPGTVSRVVYLGSVTQILLELAGGQTLQATASAADGLPPGEGEAVTVHLPSEALRVLVETQSGPG